LGLVSDKAKMPTFRAGLVCCLGGLSLWLMFTSSR
jgi:hypothetical protein